MVKGKDLTEKLFEQLVGRYHQSNSTDICRWMGLSMEEYAALVENRHAKALECAVRVLRTVARRRCNKKNCGTVCKCESCMAREALVFFDPEWRP